MHGSARASRALLALVVAAVAWPARADPAGDALLTARDVGPGWEIMEEQPGRPAEDPELVSWGVQAIRARHYTRGRAGSADVCSIEIWGFASESSARLALAAMQVPNWEFAQEGPLIVMVRALRLVPGEPPHREIFGECRELGRRAQQRARTARPGS